MFKSPINLALRAMAIFFPATKPLTFSGSGSALKLADLMIHSGHKRPLLVTDSFLLKNGMLDTLIAHLEAQGAQVTVFDGIVPNPTVAVVEAGVAAARGGNCDAVFAVGGGSSLDAAKVIAAATGDRAVSFS